MIGQTIGQLRVCMAHKGGGSGSASLFPAIPILTAPANAATVTNGTPLTVSATSTDLDLTRIDWILDPAGAATVIASDLVSPYSQSWTPTGVSLGAHVLIARAVRGAFSTDSASITITVASSLPATPTLTAPVANANVFNSVAVTVSSTTTDTNLTKMDWVLDPAGANTVVATVVGVGTPAGTFSTTWTPTGVSDGAHLLVARATNGGGSTNSASRTINVGEVLHTLVTSVTCLRAWQSDFGVHDAGGGLCDSWTDQKGGVPALQATGANQPAIVANALGTRTAVRFDGANDFMRDATLDLPSPGTTTLFVWFVFTQISWTATKLIFAAGTTGGEFEISTLTSSPNMISYDGTASGLNAGAAIGTPTRGEARWSNSTTLDYLKLGRVTLTASGTSFGNLNPGAGWNIGATSAGASAANVDFYTLLLFSGVPSNAELAALSAAAVIMYPGIASLSTPALTAPANNSSLFNSVAVTVSATILDTDLTKMEWVLDPAGANTVIATVSGVGTPAGTFSATWTLTGVSPGAHVLVARATRGASSADSASIAINVDVLHTLVTSVTCLRAWQSDFGIHDAGGGLCDSWTDQKNATAATQATGTKQPAIVANAYGTRTALRFDGVDDFILEPVLDLAAPGTTPTFLWFVCAERTWTLSDALFNAGTAGRINIQQNATTPGLVAFNGVAATPQNNGAVLSALTRGEARFGNTTADYLKLGATSTTGVNTGNNDPAAGWNIGASVAGANAANVDVLVCLIFSGIPSGAELAALTTAAAAMYPGIAV